ncbi:MAG: tetratricopeptide repeat protein [Lunatimonas sp.]|uniref:tetratricopeptide repeat protein n=1 Tax=Lunatimonas sp. TaxID=2060141 RepID=UPI00263A9F63|nr:tetratricopeptide repeat protein [Lunatimonas sp.]MCC5937174.1 tetratricopeptide repeat protein [Lunatimonas sp.]
MKVSPIVFLLSLTVMTGCIGQFQKGEAYFRNQEYEKAIAEFNRVLFVSISDVKSLHLRARSYEELEDYENAKADYRQILKYQPTYAQALAGLGKIAWKEDNMAEAEKLLLKAAMHDPDDYDILLLLGRAMIKNQRFKSAEEFLQLAIDQQPENPQPYFYLGIARGYQGDGLGVVTALNAYLSLETDNISAHYNRGFALMKLGFSDWAIEDFDEVLKRKPDHYDALARRGICLLEDNPSQGMRDIQKAAQNGNPLAKSIVNQFGSKSGRGMN